MPIDQALELEDDELVFVVGIKQVRDPAASLGSNPET